MEVIDLAIKEKRTIITFDRDYGELVFKYGHKPPSGIIYLRFKEFDEYEPGLLLLQLFEDESFKFDSLFTVLDRNHIRQKKYMH